MPRSRPSALQAQQTISPPPLLGDSRWMEDPNFLCAKGTWTGKMLGVGNSDYSSMTPPYTPGSAAQKRRLAFEKDIRVEHQASNLVSRRRGHLVAFQLPVPCNSSLPSSLLIVTLIFVSAIWRTGFSLLSLFHPHGKRPCVPTFPDTHRPW